MSCVPSLESSVPTTATMLLVEDNQGDIDLWNVILEDLGTTHLVAIARTGIQALAVLDDRAREGQPILLVITDRCLPLLDGPALVARMQQDPVLRMTPVVMLTGALPPPSVVLPCPCYQKPSTFQEWHTLMGMLRNAYPDAFLASHA